MLRNVANELRAGPPIFGQTLLVAQDFNLSKTHSLKLEA